MKRTGLNILALALGLGAGLGLKAWGGPGGAHAVDLLSPLGEAWLNGLKMTLVPLVLAMVAHGVASLPTEGAGRRLLPATLGVFLAMLLAVSLATAWGVSLLMDAWPPVARLAGLATAAAASAPPTPGLGERLAALVPPNPVAAAANGDMAAVVVFALLFGLALRRVEADARAPVVALLDGVGQASLKLIEAVLALAPVGVFVLALHAAQATGLSAAGLLAQGLAINLGLTVVVIGACYVLAGTLGGVPLARFARAAAEPQAIAAGTTSSAATLPVTMKAAREGLGLPLAVVEASLPLAASLFRVVSVMLAVSSCVMAARATGLHPDAGRLVVLALLAVVVNLGAAGLPSAAVIYASYAPLFLLMGAPLDLIPLMIAVSALPDILYTLGNVTGHLAGATVVARFVRDDARARRPRRPSRRADPPPQCPETTVAEPAAVRRAYQPKATMTR